MRIYYLIWSLLAAATILIANLLNSRAGRAIRSLRGGVVMVESLGINVFRIRLVTFVIAALLAGAIGLALRPHGPICQPGAVRRAHGHPISAHGHRSAARDIFCGAVVGAALLTLLTTRCRTSAALRAHRRQLEVIVFAVLSIVLVLQFARGGVMPFVLRYLPRRVEPAIASAEPLQRRTMPKPGEPLLVVKSLGKRFGGLEAVSRVGFEVSAGEIVGLIGPNGAGKSTVFNLVTGALSVDAGAIFFLGHDITQRGSAGSPAPASPAPIST